MDEKGQAHLFDDVRVEPAAFRVWKAGAAVPLEPKAFEVLLFLIQNRGRVVQKRELLDAVWRDTFVGENALTREIAQLRKALGEDARHARYIETVPTRGYRFIAEVSESAPAPTLPPPRDGAAPADARGTKRGRAVLASALAALALLACVAAVIGWQGWRGARGGEGTVGIRRLTQVTTST